jgi:hypothetical protein
MQMTYEVSRVLVHHRLHFSCCENLVLLLADTTVVLQTLHARNTMPGGFRSTPKGLRTHGSETWSSLRLGYKASFTALIFSTFPGIEEEVRVAAQCFARSQLNYLAGDNPEQMSYVVGFGQKWPQEVHHRDSSCTLQEGIDGECVQVFEYAFLRLRSVRLSCVC